MKKLSIFVIFFLLQVFFVPAGFAANYYEGTTEFNGHYYKIFNDPGRWQEAKTFCEQRGGHLVTIESQSEQKFLEQLLRAKGTKNSYWIGGYKINGNWKWVTDRIITYTNWANGQPDNWTQHEDTLMMYRNSNPLNPSILGTWNDLQANGECNGEAFFGFRNFGFICEWENSIENDATLETRIITLGNFSNLDEWKQALREAEMNVTGLGNYFMRDPMNGSIMAETGKVIVGVKALSYKIIKVKIPNANAVPDPKKLPKNYNWRSRASIPISAYGVHTHDVQLKLPKKLQFTLHTHHYQNHPYFIVRALQVTMTCSCGFLYKYEWELPWPDIKADSQAVYQATYRELPR